MHRSNCMEDLGMCHQCFYGLCEYCMDYDNCECYHFWGKIAQINQAKEALVSWDKDTGMRENREREAQLDLPLASGS